jgi:hypothetical protein
MEAEVALGALLARFRRISLAVAASELRWRPVSLMNGLESFPSAAVGPADLVHGAPYPGREGSMSLAPLAAF